MNKECLNRIAGLTNPVVAILHIARTGRFHTGFFGEVMHQGLLCHRLKLYHIEGFTNRDLVLGQLEILQPSLRNVRYYGNTVLWDGEHQEACLHTFDPKRLTPELVANYSWAATEKSWMNLN